MLAGVAFPSHVSLASWGDAGPVDFSGVYRLMGMMNKTWSGVLIKRKRWCLCNSLFLKSNTWFMCSKKSDFLDLNNSGCFLFWGAYISWFLNDGGREPNMFTFCVLENIYFWCLSFWMTIVSKRTITQHCYIILIKIHTHLFRRGKRDEITSCWHMK